MPGQKMGVKSDIFWSEIGPGFGEPGGKFPNQEFPGVPPGGFRQDEATFLLWLAAFREAMWASFALWELPILLHKKKVFFWLYNKSSDDRVLSIWMAGLD